MITKKLRITVLGLNYTPEPTGIAPYTTKLAEQLAAEGHNVQVLTGFPHYPEWKLMEGYSGWRKHETINGVRVTRLRHYVPKRVRSLQRIHMELSFGLRIFFARWGAPDIVLLVTPSLFSTGIALLRARYGRHQVPAGVWVQDIYSRGLEETGTAGSMAVVVMRKVEGMILRSASRVTVIHERFRSYITDSLGVPHEDVAVIRNWTHLKQQPTVDRKSTRAQFGWKENDIVVLHAGNMGVKQGLENVVEAARLADRSSSRVRFVLLGDGNQRDRIQKSSIGLERIQFIPPLPDQQFMDVLRSADILLVNEKPGLREMAVPSKLTSYFSSGLPVIAATDAQSTTAEEIQISHGGICVKPDSARELLAAAERLGTDQEFADELGQSGLRFAKESLSQQVAIVKYSRWLEEMTIAGSTVKDADK
ncbi:glycosyltransferase family 4 protein [Arthrobacter crystallopoietes]|uniref:glycosyltransferase family 4 protein n=1 Tax=Crystallibacter crystallopoietes TaxID=37928 RepID=UPI001FC99B0C|nr:glycosyltransferase family 4 protein [Arthrobacter crystallopoietes]